MNKSKMRVIRSRRNRILRSGYFYLLLSAIAVPASLTHAATDPDADNTKRNAHDTSALTPLDQSNDPADLKIVAAVRSSLTGDSNLSTNAQNIKVIVRSGVVTLRGPVDSAAEKGHIEKVAKATPGVTRVENQISIKG
ncbi:MAG: hypothetical protein JWM78_424 [Verrucomicrobiaceae bacterium]|nr:hypothetical protein [Verrucomicrobiaceae bacterium]